ncbi:hypothetical protein EC973_002214 [Apophysomyces ossiformis]|uniref:Glutamate carboxypeptidase n=1 Tax=Apophysomyces ossiformis TaxID=679940 RepID=A0A8H7ESI8_9FUNG|nr:hypothetical protein EC973_002214 [Apophysomyces ossiformis]
MTDTDQKSFIPASRPSWYGPPYLTADMYPSSYERRAKLRQDVFRCFLTVITSAALVALIMRSITGAGIVYREMLVQPSIDDPAELIKGIPSSEHIRDFFHMYASQSHLAGSERDKELAEWTRDKFIEFGITDTKIETYWPMLNLPISRRLAIVSPPELAFEASLKEDPVEEDESSRRPDVPPTFHGYSGDGNVTAPLVYVNYGRLNDFEQLVNQGIDLTGTIALVRYGKISRGLKVRAAELYGCSGVLIYTDPLDDGPVNKSAPTGSFPEGPWAAPSTVQRGTVHYLSLSTGDPTTPGYPSTENAPRVPLNESDHVPHIPSLPISWRDARPLLQALENHGVTDPDWVGGLEDIGYYTGPSEALVNLVNLNKYEIKPVWNVIGRIEGAVEPDRVVIIGNHRDAWGFGGSDPVSGSATMLELVRTLGILLKNGWTPRRTIIFASWDAEEYGTVGSTEWVEDHQDWLAKEAVAYLNVDVGVRGNLFGADASPLLHQLLYQVTRTVIDPHTGKSVYQVWKERQQKIPSGDDEEPLVPLARPLGAGSDFAAFFHHIGISSISLTYGGVKGVYHSIYDSIYWMEHFGDPTYEYHQTMTRIMGLLTLRLSDDIVLPMYPSSYGKELTYYATRVESRHAGLKLPELTSAVQKLRHASDKFDQDIEKLRAKVEKHQHKHEHLGHKTKKQVAKVNQQLLDFERAFINPHGLFSRPWYKHTVFAPGLWNGYGSQTFPALTEAVDSHDAALTRQTEEQTVRILNHARKSVA